MRTLYLDCAMGAAGDMLCAALLGLLPDPQKAVAELNAIGIPGVTMALEEAEKCGIRGHHFRVTVHGEEEDEHLHDHHHDHDHDHNHHHTTVADIQHLVRHHMTLPPAVAEDVLAVFGAIAEAESRVHGQPVEQIHFHEVGTMDALADVTAACYLLHALSPDKVAASPVHVGSGTVRCAHGVLPVPAPATALLLEGLPIYGGAIRGELCTPTGAALLRHFADAFGDLPVMTLRRTGCGMGAKDFEWTNCVRAMLGDTADATDSAAELSCNLDDMTGEEIGHPVNALRQAGALDVWTQPIQMKKDRPGTLLSVLCPPERESEFAALLLKHTATIGVRARLVRRYTLRREAVTLDSPWGAVRGKRSHGFGVDRVKPEFDDVAAIADREGLTPRQVIDRLNK